MTLTLLMRSSTSQLNGRHFQVFVVVMRSRGLGEAALKLGITKAAVSKSLGLLQRETGVELFARRGGRLQPTAAAHQLLPRAEQVTQHLEWALEEAAALRQGASRTVTVAAHTPSLIALLPGAIQRMQRTHPEVNVCMRAATPIEVLRQVAHHEVDLGVTNPPAPNTISAIQLCKRKTISEDLLVVALHKHHPLVAKPMVRPEDLAGHLVIALPEESPTSVLVRATLQEAGIKLKTGVVASTSMGVCALVHRNVGVGLINPMVLSTGVFSDIVTRPFRPRIDLQTEIYCSSLKELSNEALIFYRYIEEIAANRDMNTELLPVSLKPT